jgi:hypothetical protein
MMMAHTLESGNALVICTLKCTQTMAGMTSNASVVVGSIVLVNSCKPPPIGMMIIDWGLIMFEKIFIGLICAFGAVLFAIGALGLALGIGPVFLLLAMVTIGGFAAIGFSGLLAD